MACKLITRTGHQPFGRTAVRGESWLSGPVSKMWEVRPKPPLPVVSTGLASYFGGTPQNNERENKVSATTALGVGTVPFALGHLVVTTEFGAWLMTEDGKDQMTLIEHLQLSHTTRPYHGTSTLLSPKIVFPSTCSRVKSGSTGSRKSKRLIYIYLSTMERGGLARVCELDLITGVMRVVFEDSFPVCAIGVCESSCRVRFLVAGPEESNTPKVLEVSTDYSKGTFRAQPPLQATPSLQLAYRMDPDSGGSGVVATCMPTKTTTRNYPRAAMALHPTKWVLYRDSPEHMFHYPYGVGTADDLGPTVLIDLTSGRSSTGPPTRIQWQARCSYLKRVVDAKEETYLLVLRTASDSYLISREHPNFDSNVRALAYEVWCWKPQSSTRSAKCVWTMLDRDRLSHSYCPFGPLFPPSFDLSTMPAYIYSMKSIHGRSAYGPPIACLLRRLPVFWKRTGERGNDGENNDNNDDGDENTAQIRFDAQRQRVACLSPTEWVLTMKEHLHARTTGDYAVLVGAKDKKNHTYFRFVNDAEANSLPGPTGEASAAVPTLTPCLPWTITDKAGLLTVDSSITGVRPRDGAFFVMNTQRHNTSEGAIGTIIVGVLSSDYRHIEWTKALTDPRGGICTAPIMCHVP